MSTAEIILGSRLFTEALDAGLSQFLKAGNAEIPKEKLLPFRTAFQDLSKSLRDLQVANLTKEGEWVIDDDRIDELTEEQLDSFRPVYGKLVSMHAMHLGDLDAGGFESYVDMVRDVHLAPEFQIVDAEERTDTAVMSQVMSEPSKDQIVRASLSLIEAVHNDPANAAFVSGLARKDIETLGDRLAAAGYLLPGENPDRKAPIADQSPRRGNEDQIAAILTSAEQIAANIEIDGGNIPMSNRPLLAANMLKQSVNDAEYVADLTSLGAVNPEELAYSEYSQENIKTINSFLVAGTRMLDHANLDSDSFETVSVRIEDYVALRDAHAIISNEGIDNVYNHSRPTEIPGFSEMGVIDLHRALTALDKCANYNPEDHVIRGDEGGHSLHDEASQDDLESDAFAGEGEREEVVDDDEDEKEDDLEADEDAETDTARDVEAEIEQRSGLRDAGDDNRIHVPREFVDQFEAASFALMVSGSDKTLAILSGEMGNTAWSPLMSGVDRPDSDTPHKSLSARPNLALITDAMSVHQVNQLSQEHQSKLTKRLVRATPEHELLQQLGYKPVTASSSRKRVRNFVRHGLETQDEKQTAAFRAFLREAARNPVAAGSITEAEAWKTEAIAFVEREREERTLREQIANAKRAKDKGVDDHLLAPIPASAAKRMVSVLDAAEIDTPIRVEMTREGRAILSHEDGPKISAQIEGETRFPGHGQRPNGSFVSKEALRAGLENSGGEETINLVVRGENIVGVVGKTQHESEEKQKASAKTKAELYPDLVLS